MPAPQSASALQAFGSQVMMTICPALPSTSSLAQSALGGHAGSGGGATTPDDTQE
jgi:hypothetical protein